MSNTVVGIYNLIDGDIIVLLPLVYYLYRGFIGLYLVGIALPTHIYYLALFGLIIGVVAIFLYKDLVGKDL